MYNSNIVVLRVKKGVPGIGRNIARHFNANEVTCGFKPKFKVPDGAFIFNYGRSTWPIWADDALARGCKFINTPQSVANSVDKLRTFEILSKNGVPCLEFTTKSDVVFCWLSLEGKDVIVRNTVGGSKGKGIKLIEAKECKENVYIPNAPLYTKHYPKTHEFRVHVVDGKVVDVIQKKRMGAVKLTKFGLKEADDLIRSYRRGWVFAIHDLICDKPNGGRDVIEKIAVDATKALGMDYSGMDIVAIYEGTKLIDARVCESNSAPGVDGKTTFKLFTNAIQEMIDNNKPLYFDSPEYVA